MDAWLEADILANMLSKLIYFAYTEIFAFKYQPFDIDIFIWPLFDI